MKRFSQTLRIGLAMFLAMFGTSALPTASAFALNEIIVEQPVAETTQQTETPPTPIVEPAETPPPMDPAVIDTPESTPPQKVLTPEPPTESESTIVEEPEIALFSQRVISSDVQSAVVSTQIPVPQEPSTLDKCGGSGDTFTVPVQTGVTYYLEGKGNNPDVELSAGVHKTNGEKKVTIIAKANNGYVFTDGKTEKKFDLNFSIKCVICHRTASVSNPYVQIEVDEDAIDANTTNDNGKGDHYVEHTGPVFPATGSDGKWGDIIPPTGTHSGRNWEAGQTIYNNNCNVPVTISASAGPCAEYQSTSYLTINSVSGTAKNAKVVVINESDDVVYSVNIVTDKDTGEVTSPSFPITVSNLPAGTYTVSVVKGEQVFAPADVIITVCPNETTPVEPSVIDICYMDRDSIYIENTEGVIYKVNGEVTSGWIKYAGATLNVTAEPAEGYVFPEGAVTSWTYDSSTFTNKQCLTITKSAKVASDTNLDGKIGLGDTVTWMITVTNTSDKDCESFYVTVDDPNTVLENDGYIGYLAAGDSTTLTATSTITENDLQACKVVNTATLSGWRIHAYDKEELSLARTNNLVQELPDPLATGSASATYTLVCPAGSGGGQVLGDTTVKPAPVATPTAQVLPATLPATGASDTSNIYLVLGLVFSALTYYAMMRRYQEA